MADVKESMLDTSGNADVAVGTSRDIHDLEVLGYKAEMQRNRTMFTLLFQSLAIAAVRHHSLTPCYLAM